MKIYKVSTWARLEKIMIAFQFSFVYLVGDAMVSFS